MVIRVNIILKIYLINNLVNPYSIGLVSSFFLLFSFFLIIVDIIDFIQKKTKKYMVDPFYDMNQYYNVKLFRENFGKKIKFWKLSIYLIKVKIIFKKFR